MLGTARGWAPSPGHVCRGAPAVGAHTKAPSTAGWGGAVCPCQAAQRLKRCCPDPLCIAGRSSGRPPAPHSRLDRSAFEVAVADAAELLRAQLGSVGWLAGWLVGHALQSFKCPLSIPASWPHLPLLFGQLG